MSSKLSMFVIWAVASFLWLFFAGHLFQLDRIGPAYRLHNQYEEQVARNRSGYNIRAYNRSTARINKINKDVSMFILLGIGMPGLVLAFGTAALNHAEKKEAAKSRKKSTQ